MSFFTPEVVTGLISLGSGAFAGMMANNQKLLLASLDHTMKANAQGNQNSNDAAQRNSSKASFLQRSVGLIIIGTAFLGLLAVALLYGWVQIPVNYIYEEAGSKFLGIFGSGKDKIKAMELTGFVIPPYVKYSVISVVNFLFGASVVKLRRI